MALEEEASARGAGRSGARREGGAIATPAGSRESRSLRLGLPAQPTPLVGRDSEVAAVVELLRDPETRLVTLTGPGGVGKTRLALEAATQAEDAFPDGVSFVPAAPVADPTLLASVVARGLGLREEGGRSLTEILVSGLSERHLLLVLDNMEHLLPAAPLLAELAAGAPELNVLVTSREPLRLRGERDFVLAPLELPDLERLPADAGELLRSPAVAVFVARAQAANPEFALTDVNAAAVADICTRVDGLPLALELAAARIRFLSPQAMLDRLERPLDLLTSGLRDLPVRQRTLRSTIAWSHGLLSEPEQAVFARLSVFAGGATLEAAEAVGAGDEPGEVLDRLGRLVDRSLLLRTESEAGEIRLGMLETIREFALEQLAESGEEETVRLSHARHFLRLAEESELELRTRGEEASLARLGTEHDNLRAALRFFLDAEEYEASLRLAGALAHFWLVHGYVSEGREWLAQALARPDGAPAHRAKALLGAGVLAHYQNDYDLAARLLEESLGLARELGDPIATADALNGLATVVGRHVDPAAARVMGEEALGLLREAGDDARAAVVLERLGTIRWYEGAGAAARPLLEESLALSRRLGLRLEEANALQALGWAALEDGEPAEAERLLEEALGLLRGLGDRWSEARAHFGLGYAAVAQGRLRVAQARFDETLRIVTDLGDRLLTAGALGGLAAVAVRGRRLGRAVLLLAAAERLRSELGATHSAYVRASHERSRAEVESALGAEALEEARERCRRLGLHELLALVRVGEDEEADEPYPGGLTRREAEVVRLVARGLTDAQIAAELVVSVRTVNAHLRTVYRKLGVGSRAAATRWALEHDLV